LTAAGFSGAGADRKFDLAFGFSVVLAGADKKEDFAAFFSGDASAGLAVRKVDFFSSTGPFSGEAASGLALAGLGVRNDDFFSSAGLEYVWYHDFFSG